VAGAINDGFMPYMQKSKYSGGRKELWGEYRDLNPKNVMH